VSTSTYSPASEPNIALVQDRPQFAPTMSAETKLRQPATTLSGSPIQAIAKGLPKATQSLCPECTRLVDARLFEENGKVYMEKTCPDHGYIKDLYYSDAKLYLKMEQWHFGDGVGVSNPAIPDAERCPSQCGLCSMHASHTGLANLDLTNRCNLTCPVCFANANSAGYLYEPSFTEVRKMLQALRNERPVAGRIVQFSGGEPTIYPRFFDVLTMAKEMGFSHIQAATNGIMLADPDFAKQAKEAGLSTLYLQFDGVSDDVYRKTRGENLVEIKQKVIENCRATGMKIVFVPTIVRGVNDHQIGDIVRTAVKNADVVSAITFQPVTFTGRIAMAEREAKRFTMADVAIQVGEQSGYTDTYSDWFPLACVTPFSMLISALRGEQTTHLTCHPHCSLGTYLFVHEETGTVTPITRFVDVGGLLQELYKVAGKAEKSTFQLWNKIKVWNNAHKYFHEEYAPPGLTFQKFLQTLQGMTDKKLGRDGGDGTYTYRTILVSAMHFMDSYNYDIDRVKRCVIHYAAPNGLIYPFCAYNSGPVFRDSIEKKYSMPLEEQLNKPELLQISAK
jgi:7,8-dihydro-6-hydroxymethylpterin dimethyltransferase